MNTTIPDKTFGVGATACRSEAVSTSGYSLPRQVSSRKHADEDHSDKDRAAGTKPAESSKASTEDAHRFAAAMRADHQNAESLDADSASEQESDAEKKDNGDTEPSAQLSFASLFAGRFDAGAAAEPAKAQETQPAESSRRAESLAEHLAERILVSEASSAGQQVCIQPSRDILPDTEISLVRGTDGLLSAIIHTNNSSSFQMLASAQHDLRARLEMSEGQPVRVELRSSADDDNDPRRRSRGLDMDPLA